MLWSSRQSISYNVLHIRGKVCNISSHTHGQHGSPVILNENGGYQKPGVDCDQQGNLAITFETKDHHYCQIITRVTECTGRQGIQANHGFKQMETKSNNLHEIASDKGNSRDDLFASRVLHQLPHYISWKIDPFSQGRDAFQISWAHKFVYAFPRFALIGRVLQKVNQDQCLMLIITPA